MKYQCYGRKENLLFSRIMDINITYYLLNSHGVYLTQLVQQFSILNNNAEHCQSTIDNVQFNRNTRYAGSVLQLICTYAHLKERIMQQHSCHCTLYSDTYTYVTCVVIRAHRTISTENIIVPVQQTEYWSEAPLSRW